MKVKERKHNSKTPTVTFDPALDGLDGKVLFKEKLDRANEMLKKHPFPEELLKDDK